MRFLKSFTKQEKSWIMYDWANSVFATIMVAAVFPIYFTNICDSATGRGDMWWGIGTSIATAILAVFAPLLGSLADYRGYKIRLFRIFLIIGLVFTLCNAFTDAWPLMLVGYMLSQIGWSGSCFMYDSLLSDVTTEDRMDKVSSMGYGMGYIGGSTIPFVVSIVLISTIGGALAVKLSLVITVLWWGIFSIPILRGVKQKYGKEIPQTRFIKDAAVSMTQTFKEIAGNKGILIFLVAYFFYIDGVNTVINMATSYGTTLKLDQTSMILALMVTQLVAFPFAILFGRLSEKVGAIKMLLSAIGVYCFICILGFFMGFGLEESYFGIGAAQIIFWILAVLVGMVQGGIQAISRSYYLKLVPPEKSGEFFGFFDIFGKFAAVLGPALYALIKGMTGRSSFSILSIILLFLIALAILLLGWKHIVKK